IEYEGSNGRESSSESELDEEDNVYHALKYKEVMMQCVIHDLDLGDQVVTVLQVLLMPSTSLSLATAEPTLLSVISSPYITVIGYTL
ncbi:6745_t:CDS:2, partial [Paraglomus brasilianum]